jgi:archaemetzincin
MKNAFPARILTRRSLLAVAACAPALSRAAALAATDPLSPAIARIRPLFKTKLPPQPGDWLAEHKEPGQTYAQFRGAVSKPAVENFSTLRVVPIGPLTAGQQAVLDIVIDFLKPFFGLPLALDPAVPLEGFPEDAIRLQDFDPPYQLLTTYLLNDVLMTRRQPKDAAVLGISASDLWPGPGWNFVFGQASLKERVGVWSMARNGDADGRPAMRKICAMRTVMTATHETGHMFGIRHCTAYECGMNGSNHSDERDRQPLEFCPECQPKLWWTLKLDPLARSRALEALARRHGFDNVAAGLAKQSAALRIRT